MKVDLTLINMTTKKNIKTKENSQISSGEISFDKVVEEKLKLLRDKKQNKNDQPLNNSIDLVINNDDVLNLQLIEPVLKSNEILNFELVESMLNNNSSVSHDMLQHQTLDSKIINQISNDVLANNNIITKNEPPISTAISIDNSLAKDVILKEVAIINQFGTEDSGEFIVDGVLINNINNNEQDKNIINTNKTRESINLEDGSTKNSLKVDVKIDSENIKEDFNTVSSILLKQERFTDTQKIKVSDGILIKSENDFANKISEKILVNINDAKTEFEINLFPKHLGKIKVNILFEATKTVVSITCSSIRTKGLMESNLDSIRNIIQNNTNTTSYIYLDEKDGYLRDDENHHQGSEKEQEKEQKQTKQNEQLLEETDMFIKKLRLGLLENSS